ncbi:hypothetical protein ACLOJK_029887 [Asimina triloba]
MAALPFQSPITHAPIFNRKSKYFSTHYFSQAPNNKSLRGYNHKGSIQLVKASSTKLPPFKLFEPPEVEDSTPSELEPADPDFYKIGFARSVRAFGVEFMEGPDGFGVYASKDVEPLRRARHLVHTLFGGLSVTAGLIKVISAVKQKDWDLRLACLLLFSFDCKDNFWQSYGDFLPSAEECTSLLLATEEELMELQDPNLASTMREHHRRALEFWEKNWHSSVPLKIRRLARDPERFIWAVSMAQSRCIAMKIRIGALVQDSNMLVPYADMLNHSFQPNCFFHWRFKDRMLEVMTNAGQRIKKGEENPWDVIQFSGNAKIHLDSFLSVFNISGLKDDFYHNSRLSNGQDSFVDGAVIAAARTLPTWSDGDVPSIPSMERNAAQELQDECHRVLTEFPTSSEEDLQILESNPEASRTLEAAIKYVIFDSCPPEL